MPENSPSLTVSGILGRMGMSRGLFPLTPALSPEERGELQSVGGRNERYELAQDAVEGQGCSKVGSGHTKPETRRPKAERNPKAEVRIDSHPGGAAANRIRPLSKF